MELLKKILDDWNIVTDDVKLSLFGKYIDLLLSYNEKVNLTSITEHDEIIIKHFADSLAVMRFIDLSGLSLIDVGTGAGFPGIPLAIICPSCKILLVDSLAKRVVFLNEVIDLLDLKNVSAIHGRVEDIARDVKYRSGFDVAVARAVAGLDVLCEYCLPFVKTGGTFISYKGRDCGDELEKASNAMSMIGASVIRCEKYDLPYSDVGRSLIFIKKEKDTDERFPRRAGIPSKKPL